MWQSTNNEDMAQAAAALKDGEVVAFPTETVYGLGADGLNETACRKIYSAKERPADNPLILHIAERAMLDALVRTVPDGAEILMKAFWPGPLTLLFPKSDAIPAVVTAGLDTVAVRMPAHPVALSLIRDVHRPLAAPSANKSGRPSPTAAWHVAEDFGDEIAGIVDGGDCAVGVESTILDLTRKPPVLLRPGGISREAIEALIGPVLLAGALSENAPPPAPGMKYRHYAPKSPVWLAPVEEDENFLHRLIAQAEQSSKSLGLLLSDDAIGFLHAQNDIPPNVRLWNLGPRTRPDVAAARLFDGLRRLDDMGVSEMFIGRWPEEELGLALMNRITKLSRPWKG